MCDISKKTKLKTKTVYKAVLKIKRNYYSIFSGKKLTVGRVEPLTKREARFYGRYVSRSPLNYFDEDDWAYNPEMVGRVSGFGKMKDAMIQSNTCWAKGRGRVLRVVLGGDIMKGTCQKINLDINWPNPTYAGTEIISMEEIQ